MYKFRKVACLLLSIVILSGCSKSVATMEKDNNKNFKEKINAFILSDDVELSKEERNTITNNIGDNVVFKVEVIKTLEDEQTAMISGYIDNKSNFNIYIELDPIILDAKNKNINGDTDNKYGGNVLENVNKGEKKSFEKMIPIKKDSIAKTVLFNVNDFEIR